MRDTEDDTQRHLDAAAIHREGAEDDRRAATRALESADIEDRQIGKKG
jgi:hypothetical protein